MDLLANVPSVTVISIVRLVFLVQMKDSINLTWDYFDVCLWSTVEITVGIMCTCMPTLRLILVRMSRRVGSTISHRSAHGSQESATGSNTTDTWASHATILIEYDGSEKIMVPRPVWIKRHLTTEGLSQTLPSQQHVDLK